MSEKGKKIWKSKTLVFGGLQLISGIALLCVNNDLVKQHPGVVAVATSVSGLVTILLRFLTDAPIKWEE